MEIVGAAVIGAGQSGLAAANALRAEGLTPVVLEASDQAAGSWPRYYDSLTLFSPARYAALPGLPFGGDPDRYPHRDEVIAYLLRYADRIDAEIRLGVRVEEVEGAPYGFTLHLADGTAVGARAVVAATGGFGRPHRPNLPALDGYTGTVLHAADYRSPHPFAGQHVVVVGAGNSAVQIAAELADHADTVLATRTPVRFARQRALGRDLHFWLTVSGVDIAPVGRLLRRPPAVPVFDTGHYRAALAARAPERRPVFTAADGTTLTWTDGVRETVDAVILATGYRPDLPYLEPLGALDPGGLPLHRAGLSTVHPALAYVGLEWQRSLSSASLRGVGRDAAHVARRLARRLRGRAALPY
ncbi:flavin-containing monooxygenase [Kitasatospora sp. NPDC004240]